MSLTIEKIKDAAIAAARERIQQYPRHEELQGMQYEVHGIVRYAGADIVTYGVMVAFRFRCPDCDELHGDEMPISLAGEDLVPMVSEVVEQRDDDEEEGPSLRVALMPMSELKDVIWEKMTEMIRNGKVQKEENEG